MSDPRTKVVGTGYDAMIDTWESWAASIHDDPRRSWCADLIARLTPGARVLELGCGGGTRETQELAADFVVTGIDLSERQLERARIRVPSASVPPLRLHRRRLRNQLLRRSRLVLCVQPRPA